MEPQRVDAQKMMLDIPRVEVPLNKLPSRGIAYPKDAKIFYRTYTFGEIKMSSIANVQIVSALENTMRGIETEGFPKDNLTLLDTFYIGVLRKVSTIQHSKMEVPYVCEYCGSDQKAVFDEGDLEFDSIDADVKTLPIRAQVGGKELEFVPLTVRDFLAAQKGRWSKYIVGGEIDRTALNALMIKNMDFPEAYKFLYQLTDSDDIDVVTEVDKLLLHDLKPIVATCKNELPKEMRICNYKNEIKLQGKEPLIRPFRSGESTARSRIHLGVSQDS